jgi:glycine cleavage system H protein|tara:strand:- start:43 stop:465 length:423 start_codon:yes stop_codon:yes gene_type:complete
VFTPFTTVLEQVMAVERKYAQSHEWIRLEDDGTATIGVSAYAVEALTDLVFIQLPDIGQKVKAGESFGEIESVKAVSDLYAPVSGEVVAVNTDLPGELEILGDDPYQKGWIMRIKPDNTSDVESLLDQQSYDALIAKQSP